YRELNNRSNKLSNYLILLGIGPENLVSICFERSIQLIVSIIAIFKSGSAYVPIDPNYPTQRKIYLMTNSNAKFNISNDILFYYNNLLKKVVLNNNKNKDSFYNNNKS